MMSIASCTKKEDVVHDEAEILSAAQERISQSVLWNKIFYIDGFSVLENGKKTGNYREVDPAYLDEIGMTRISDIKEYGKTVYSTAMLALFDETLFSSIKNDVGGVSTSAVCFDYYEKKDGVDRFICVMVDPDESPRFGASDVDYLFDTMQVVYNLNGRATVSLSVQKSGEPENVRTLRVSLLLENETWLLDGYTFVVFPSNEQ
jgi:hypothetical protein